MEDEPGNDQTKKNSNDAVANVIEIGVGRVSLKDAVEECEGELQPGITDSFAAGRDPTGDGSGTSYEDHERRDRFHVRHEEHDGEKSERAADKTTDEPQSPFVERGLSAPERYECTGNERRMDSVPIDRLVNDVAEHRGEGDFECEMRVRRISERVRHKQTTPVRLGLRFRRMFRGRRRVR